MENRLPQATEAAEKAKRYEVDQWRGRRDSPGLALPKLVHSIEKELGRKAAPFNLEFRILPVAGLWLHQVAPNCVLMSFDIQSDPDAMGRLLGPVVRELAR